MPVQSFPAYFFTPRHIILIGASESPFSLGERVLTALLGTPFQGKITPVNLRHKIIAGLQTYSSLTKIEEAADLVVAVTPPKSYESLFKACLKKQFYHIILIQNWDNLSEDEWHTAEQVLAKYRNSELNISVCNPAGIQIPAQGLNAGMLPDFAAGHLAMVTGSEAVSYQINLLLSNMQQGVSRHISMNYALSPTSTATWINRFGRQRHTRAALVHYNPLEHQGKLFSAIRQFTRHTPLILHCTEALSANDKAVLECLSRHCQFIPTFNEQDLKAALHAHLTPHKPVQSLHVLANTPIEWLQNTVSDGIKLIMPSEKPNLHKGNLGSNPSPTRYRSLVSRYLQQPQTEALLAVIAPTASHDEAALTRILNMQQTQSDKPVLISSQTANGLMQFDQAETAVKALLIQNQREQLKQYLLEQAAPWQAKLQTPSVNTLAELWQSKQFAELAQTLCLPEYQAKREHDVQIDFYRHPNFGMILTAQYQGNTFAALPPFTTQDTETLIRFACLKAHRKAVFQALYSLNTLVTLKEHGKITLYTCNGKLYSDFMPSEKKPKKNQTAAGKFLGSKSEAAAEFIRSRSETAAEFIRTHSEAAAELLKQKNEPSVAENVFVPYPTVSPDRYTLKNGETVYIRALEPEDATAKQAFIRNLSTQSRQSRFMTQTNELPALTLARLSKLDYRSEGAWIAENSDGIMLGIVRISRVSNQECEFAITLADNMHGSGLAIILMQLIIRLATQQGYQLISAEILKSNIAMQKLAEKSGFTLSESEHDKDLYQAKLSLNTANGSRKYKLPQ